MKDKVMMLYDKKYYVLDEINYKDNKYIFAVQIDDNDEMIEETMHSFEVFVENEIMKIKEIEDFEVSSVVNNLFISRQINEN